MVHKTYTRVLDGEYYKEYTVTSGFSAAVAITKQSTIFSVDEYIEFSDPVLTNEGRFLSVQFREVTSCVTTPGDPALPFYIKLFTFPFGKIISDVY